MRLYHFSDDPTIATFVPRPVLIASSRPVGMEWLNGPLVWAIEEELDFLYHFPRDCPRILIWATDATTAADKDKWLGSHRAAAYVERSWLGRCADAILYRYELPPEEFKSLNDAGMHVSRLPVTPTGCTTLVDLPGSFAPRNIDLRVVEDLLPLRELWATSLHTSGIRLKNAGK